ncbi:MFS transporter [Amycolatopsis sp. NPDC051373]|uniref:MFS transporter n=1 Tax=Amycolatopsis sp. NPDC051373 TaxID=3155801 RepID=UPI00344FBBB6
MFAVFGAAAAAQTGTGRLGTRTRRHIGLLAQAVGIAVLAVGMHAASLPVFLLAGIIAGAGAGVLFKSAVGHVATTATPARRGEALAGLFLASYLGLALLPAGLGVASRSMNVTAATTWFAAVVLALLAAVAVLTRHRGPTTSPEPANARPLQEHDGSAPHVHPPARIGLSPVCQGLVSAMLWSGDPLADYARGTEAGRDGAMGGQPEVAGAPPGGGARAITGGPSRADVRAAGTVFRERKTGLRAGGTGGAA